MKHLTDFFFERHLAEKIFDSIGSRNPVVLVRIQRAVAVQIAEYLTVTVMGSLMLVCASDALILLMGFKKRFVAYKPATTKTTTSSLMTVFIIFIPRCSTSIQVYSARDLYR